MKHTSFVRLPFACLLYSVGMITFSLAADIGIKNGDFSSSKQFWRGDGTVVTLPDGNKVIELMSDVRRQDQISQEIEMGALVAIEVRFRARFIGGKGQMKAKLQRKNGGATLFTFDLPPEGDWRDISFKHTRDNARDDRILVLHTLPYKGKLQIDDVWAGEPGTYQPATRPKESASPARSTSTAPSTAVIAAPASGNATMNLLEDSEWIWGSGGRLKLSHGGVARHTSWKTDGGWRLDSDRTLLLQRPGGDPPMTVIFPDLDYMNGEVTSHTGASTTIKRVVR